MTWKIRCLLQNTMASRGPNRLRAIKKSLPFWMDTSKPWNAMQRVSSKIGKNLSINSLVSSSTLSYTAAKRPKGHRLDGVLQFERDKCRACEREGKATIKVLVKEIKHCRAQIVALQSERDGYRDHTESLRRTVLHGNGHGSLIASRDRLYEQYATTIISHFLSPTVSSYEY
jgi:DNA gyrase/topoisomerase IV subunit A